MIVVYESTVHGDQISRQVLPWMTTIIIKNMGYLVQLLVILMAGDP